MTLMLKSSSPLHAAEGCVDPSTSSQWKRCFLLQVRLEPRGTWMRRQQRKRRMVTGWKGESEDIMQAGNVGWRRFRDERPAHTYR
eukprot:5265692-Amphidinium_carterae.1